MYFQNQDNQEPAPSKWQTWAQEEVQQQKLTSVSPVVSPKIKDATIPITTTTTNRTFTLSQPTQQQLPPVPKKTISTPTVRDSTKYAAPTLDQIDFVLLDPPHCFCNRPAHRSYTLEYGPILECATYGPLEQGKFICGFHVHEYSWQQFRNQVKQTGGTIESQYTELKSCALYNFSFCTLFHLSNPYDKVPPTVIPNCFCGLPVKLREKYITDRKQLSIYFTCPNSSNEGVKKCSWYLDSKKVAFIKPSHRLHTLVDKEAYDANYLDQKNSLAQEQQQQLVSQSQHHSELLATLSAKSPTSHLVVPTSVLANHKKQPVASLSSSSSTSTSSTLSSPTFHQHHAHHPAQLSLDEEDGLLGTNVSQIKKDAKARIQEVESQLFQYIERATQAESDTVKYQKKMNQLKSEVTQLSTEVTHLTTDMKHLTTELNHLKVQYEREHILRINAQAGTSQAEVKNLELHAEIENIQDKFEQYRESVLIKYGKEEEYNKCKVCFHRNIEYVLTPCFHLGKFFF